MAKSSKQIQNFLTAVGADPTYDVQIVPRSESCAEPGDVVFFRYSLGTGPGSRAERLLLVTKPVTRDAATGNLLLYGFKLPADGDYTPASLNTLYTSGDYGVDDLRTYIMTNLYGQLKRIRKQ